MNTQTIGLVGCAFAGLTFGQGTVGAGSPVTGTFSAATSFNSRPIAPPTVAGAPYSGEQVFESVQVLADGTRITRKSGGQNQKMYRDFAGRIRIDRALFPAAAMSGNSAARDAVVSEIYDPIASFRYTLDSINHVAHRQKLQPVTPPAVTNPAAAPIPAGSPAPRENARPMPTMSSESLGTQLINGVQAEGHRTIQTIPAEAQGNDRPITVTVETWYSPELKLTVLSKRLDPRSGDATTQILNLSRAEPDPFLFTVPAGYSIVDETGPFTIRSGSSKP